MDPLTDFLAQHVPTATEIAIGGPLLTGWAIAGLTLAGWLRTARGWRTGYTRKTFHLFTFCTATAIQQNFGLPITGLFGGMTSLVLLYATWRGNGHPLYEALARPEDAPHRTHFVVVPCLATLSGGLLITINWPATAAVGFLVCGLGDAAGEPVGTRFGRHPYRVPLPGRVASTRTLEGSFGVFLASVLATGIAGLSVEATPTTALLIGGAVGIGGAAALAEAVSPHGWDNLVMMVGPTALAHAIW